MNKNHETPEAATGNLKLAAMSAQPSRRLVRKRVIASLNSVSLRTCDNWLHAGCPHIKPSSRLTLFDPDEVAAWLKQTYGQRRIGKEQPN